jgi:entry exclusion lipoprotein TrbK
MITKRPALLTLAAPVAALISACSPETPKKEMPAVNDENCKPEKIAQVEDKGTREQFASACLRRGPGVPTESKERMVGSPMSMAAVGKVAIVPMLLWLVYEPSIPPRSVLWSSAWPVRPGG